MKDYVCCMSVHFYFMVESCEKNVDALCAELMPVMVVLTILYL
jgi:hypothetical protein